jgi:hypothetical protein
MAMTMTPTTAAAMGSVAIDKAGVGSAVLNSARQVGGSLGIAVMGAIVGSATHVSPRNPAFVEQFVRGYHHGLYTAAGLAVAGALVAMLTVRKIRRPEAAQIAAAA